MLQQRKPDDYVIATGKTHSVKEFVELVFNLLGLSWKRYVVKDERSYRPAEVYDLKGDSTKARQKLGWRPKVNFEKLVKMMVEADLKTGKKEKF